MDRRVEVAVLETAGIGVLEAGLGFDRCTVAAVLNLANDHTADIGISPVDEMARVMEVVVATADDMVVLNADDPCCAAMASACAARHLCYVTMSPENEAVDSHIHKGGRAVRVETLDGRETAVLYDDGGVQLAIPVDELPSTRGGQARHNVQNAIFAAGIAYGLGLPVDAIEGGLRVFGR